MLQIKIIFASNLHRSRISLSLLSFRNLLLARFIVSALIHVAERTIAFEIKDEVMIFIHGNNLVLYIRISSLRIVTP